MKNTLHLLFMSLLTIGLYFTISESEANKTNATTKKTKTVAPYDAATYLKDKAARKLAGEAKMDEPEMYGIIQQQLRTPIGKKRPEYKDNYLLDEYRKAKAKMKPNPSRDDLDFISRGPGNVAGRTRAIIVDPRDASHSTWIAGSASGGIWKTVDAGITWRNVSRDLPNLSTNTLGMSVNNPDVIYAGTGEHFVSDTDGNGMFKSIDGGESWFQIADPESQPGFKNVSRIVVDPNDENVVLASTSNGSWVQEADYGIWKTVDGGDTWTRVYDSGGGRIDDLDANPANFNTIYATIQGFGSIKTYDAGETWNDANLGFVAGGRGEFAISPVDTNRLWISSVGGSSLDVDGSPTGADLFVSENGGALWARLDNAFGNYDFLVQGFYDNIITAHPYDANIAYVGGVDIAKVEFTGETLEDSDGYLMQRGQTSEFMDFINAAGFTNGSFNVEGSYDENVNVEIRFGQGTQKAHRFTVGMQGAGVPANGYLYQDFVEVPFQVWDIDNDRQLHVSFRDQQEDGTWNLIANETGSGGPQDSREYLFVNNVEYSDEPLAGIAQNGGHEFEEMYFIWPTLSAGGTFDPDNLPMSSLGFAKIQLVSKSCEFVTISDAYGGGINQFFGENFELQEAFHPDQHGIVMIPENDDRQEFRFLVTNDGGVFISVVGSDPGTSDGDFEFRAFDYVTTQFYGADKAPGEDRYIGGMQDNGTFMTYPGEEADSSTRYNFVIGGDGFESLWNNRDGNLLIGGSQFNNFSRSLNNGASWQAASNGFGGQGPFVTRLANSKSLPDRIYTVSSDGVYFSNNFGGLWQPSFISEMWSFNNSTDIQVSDADHNVIWAGGNLSEDSRVHVSQDGGCSFTPVSNYTGSQLGFVSGIGTHSQDPGTAYLLFSFSGLPKVIKTTDFGQSWEDISGFEGNNGVSDRGFPDVAINALLVFPNDANRIWVGSEIGIIESLDGGVSWSLLDANMPPANTWDFKIQDDQVVIATYGRGIWSVEVPEVEREIVFAPLISEATQSPTGVINLDALLGSVYDSLNITVDEIPVLKFDSNEAGDTSTILPNDGVSGDIILQIVAYSGDQVLKSPPYKLTLFDISDVITNYSNDFDEADRPNEFTGFGFQVILENGFDNLAIHSDHPHPDQSSYTYTLTKPYVLSEGSTNLMRYDEVALIEPGTAGTVFGDFEFWDFVVVEGTKDGANWTPIADGYDSRAYPSWLERYNSASDEDDNSTAVGDQGLYETTTVSLLDTYEIGDTILLRFRLTSDQAVFGWGWAIDNVLIGDLESSVFDEPLTELLSVFPNPVSEELSIKIPTDVEISNIQVYDIDGKLMLNQNVTGSSEIRRVNMSDFSSGTYFVRIQGQEVNEIHKVVKI